MVVLNLDASGSERLKLLIFLPIQCRRKREEKVGVAPIPGIRSLAASKAQQEDFPPPAVFDIEASAKPGDGSGQRNNRKAAGAEENGVDDLTLEEEIEPSGEAPEDGPARQVDFFA